MVSERQGEIRKEYGYDKRGNLTAVLENGTWKKQYVYGAMNRLEEAVDAAGKQARYQYNGLGHRVGKQEGVLPKEKLEKLELPVLEEWGGENVSQMVNGKDYKFYANKEGFYRMRLSFETDQNGVLEYENERGNHQIPFGMGNHQIGMFPEYDQLCASSGAWCSKDTFHVCCQMIDESVAAIHFKLVFAENGTMTILMKKTEETKFNEFQGVYTAVG